jgi:hypothetical protein
MRPVTRAIFYCAVFVLAAGPSKADICRAGPAERVAEEIGRLFNDLSADNALMCSTDGSAECEIVCTSPQRISVDDRRRDVLPLLTAVAAMAMRSVGKADVSAITFMDSRLATQGRSLHLPAARALQLYSSLDDGTLDVRDFRANVVREFAEKVAGEDSAKAAGEVSEKVAGEVSGEVSDKVAGEVSVNVAGEVSATVVAMIAEKPDAADAPPIPLAALVLPLPRPRNGPAPAPDFATASIPQAQAADAPALSDVPLPRRRPKKVSRPRPKPVAPPPG